VSCGWLSPSTDAADAELAPGIKIDRAKFPTRYSEYKFARDALAKLEPGTLLDAGCGANPEIHVFGYIAASLGWSVTAVDADWAVKNMPHHPKVGFGVIDITKLWSLQGAEFSAWTCISTLEHMDIQEQLCTVEAAYGCLRAGGYAIMTADSFAPAKLRRLLLWAGFETDGIAPQSGAHLTPPVAWAIGRKP